MNDEILHIAKRLLFFWDINALNLHYGLTDDDSDELVALFDRLREAVRDRTKILS